MARGYTVQKFTQHCHNVLKVLHTLSWCIWCATKVTSFLFPKMFRGWQIEKDIVCCDVSINRLWDLLLTLGWFISVQVVSSWLVVNCMCGCTWTPVCEGCVWWPDLQSDCIVSQSLWWETSVNKTGAPLCSPLHLLSAETYASPPIPFPFTHFLTCKQIYTLCPHFRSHLIFILHLC